MSCADKGASGFARRAKPTVIVTISGNYTAVLPVCEPQG